MFSQGCPGGDGGMDLHGHASPRGVPAIEVREEGQMGASPSIRTSHRVGKGTTGTDEARVDGWDRR